MGIGRYLMSRRINHLLIGEVIQAYSMYVVSGQLTVVLVTLWWFRNLERDCR